MKLLQIIIFFISAGLFAYSTGTLTVILIYLKKLKKPNFKIVLLGGCADFIFMLIALIKILSTFEEEGIFNYIRLIAFILTAITFSQVHKSIEKKI